MNKPIYQKATCRFKECAFPMVQCSECVANPLVFPINLVQHIIPKNNYDFYRTVVNNKS